MRFPIRLYRIFLRAPLALPLLLAVLSAKVLLDPGKVTQSSTWVVVDARGFRAHVDSLTWLLTGSLLQLPWQVMASSVKLEVLVALEAFVTDLAHEPVCGQ